MGRVVYKRVGSECIWVGFGLNPNPNPVGFLPQSAWRQQQLLPPPAAAAAGAATAAQPRGGAAASPAPAPLRRCSGAGPAVRRTGERERSAWADAPPPAPPAWPASGAAGLPLLAVCRERGRNMKRERERGFVEREGLRERRVREWMGE